MNCPRCGAPLTSATLGTLSYDRCTGCGGGLVALRHLDAALAALPPADLPDNPDLAMTPVPDVPGPVACPLCERRMSRGSYLEQNLVHIDRCTSCLLVFWDAGELEAMAEQRARSDRQRSARKATSEAVRLQMKWLVSGATV